VISPFRLLAVVASGEVGKHVFLCNWDIGCPRDALDWPIMHASETPPPADSSALCPVPRVQALDCRRLDDQVQCQSAAGTLW